MYTKSKQRTLIIVFVILAIIVAVLKFIDYQKGDKTFRSDLIKVDTSEVTTINFFPKSTNFKQVELSRNGKTWNVKYNNKSWSADPAIIKSILSQMSEMKTERIAATDKSKWKELGVSQEAGVRVQIKENRKTVADFIAGKISYSQSSNPYYQRGSMNTNIRLLNSGDDKVYAVSGYLGMMLNREANSFRNGLIVSIDRNNINKITFQYPGDISFVLYKKANSWMINDMPADSLNAVNYVNTISQLSSHEFDDDFNISSFTKPICTLKIEGDRNYFSEVKAFSSDDTKKYVLISSQNSNVKFNGDKNDLFKRVFIGKQKLTHK